MLINLISYARFTRTCCLVIILCPVVETALFDAALFTVYTKPLKTIEGS